MLFVTYKPTEIRSDLQRIGERNTARQCLIAIFENWSVTRERVKKKEKLINIYKFARQQKCFPWHFYKANVLSFFCQLFSTATFFISLPKIDYFEVEGRELGNFMRKNLAENFNIPATLSHTTSMPIPLLPSLPSPLTTSI